MMIQVWSYCFTCVRRWPVSCWSDVEWAFERIERDALFWRPTRHLSPPSLSTESVWPTTDRHPVTVVLAHRPGMQSISRQVHKFEVQQTHKSPVRLLLLSSLFWLCSAFRTKAIAFRRIVESGPPRPIGGKQIIRLLFFFVVCSGPHEGGERRTGSQWMRAGLALKRAAVSACVAIWTCASEWFQVCVCVCLIGDRNHFGVFLHFTFDCNLMLLMSLPSVRPMTNRSNEHD